MRTIGASSRTTLTLGLRSATDAKDAPRPRRGTTQTRPLHRRHHRHPGAQVGGVEPGCSNPCVTRATRTQPTWTPTSPICRAHLASCGWERGAPPITTTHLGKYNEWAGIELRGVQIPAVSSAAAGRRGGCLRSSTHRARSTDSTVHQDPRNIGQSFKFHGSSSRRLQVSARRHCMVVQISLFALDSTSAGH